MKNNLCLRSGIGFFARFLITALLVWGIALPMRSVAAGDSTPAPATVSQTEADALAEEEYKKQREQIRQEQMEEAREFVQTADEKVSKTLPYPLNILMGVSFFGITLWRYLAGAALLAAAVGLSYYVRRRFRTAERLCGDGECALSGRQLVVSVLTLALRGPVRMTILGLLVRATSSLLVTRYHPDIVWVANLLIFLGFVAYLFDLVGIVDRVYGNRLFKADHRLVETVRPILVLLARGVVILFAGMHIYHEVTGKTMVSILAGLGLGGVAIALASQETLRNLLGFASIAFDRAFLVGDAVNVAEYEGTVEHVGLRSIRLRTYDGNAVVIPNNAAINSNVVNLNRRPFVRREIRIHLHPQNPYAKVEEAMRLIREVVELHEGKVPGLSPVVRFVDFEPARFVIQALFWYDAKKAFFFDECSRINMEIAKRLSEAGVMYAER